jgi:hypothetical protein
MAELIFRLPGKEQYSYVEVSASEEEAGTEGFAQTLKSALADLNSIYPGRAAGSSAAQSTSTQNTNSDLPDFAHCPHGDMKFVKGGAGRKAWSAYFCPLPKEATNKCKPIDASTGEAWN